MVYTWAAGNAQSRLTVQSTSRRFHQTAYTTRGIGAYNTGTYLIVWPIPNARTDLLATASQAWTNFAAAAGVSDASATLKGLRDPLSTVRAPEIDDAVTIFNTLDNAGQAVAAAATTLAKKLQKFHDDLGDLRTVLGSTAVTALPAQ